MQRSTLVKVVIASIALDASFGVAFSFAQHINIWNALYFATTTGTTVGYGDITPVGWLPHLLTVGLMLMVIPLFTSVFSLFTVWLTSKHVDKRHREREASADRRHEDMKRHVSEVHSGGSCSYPGRNCEPGDGERGTCLVCVFGVPGHNSPADAPGDPEGPGS